jgi:sugar transferase (PEP-CTERM/EpsH1 system associated)
MKILWVKAGGLVPLDSGGKIRSFHIASELAKMHEVTFFTFCGEDSSDAQRTLSSTFHKVVIHPLKVRAGRGIGEALDYMASFFAALPHSISKYCRPGVARHLREVVAAEAYDVILCDFLSPAAVIPFDCGIPVVIFTHNVEATIWKRHMDVAKNPIWRFVFKREYEKMRAAELHFLSRATHVLTVSDTDTDMFARDIDRTKITTIPTGVDIRYFRPYFQPMSGEEPGSLVFTGSMDWMPNVDGIVFFVEQILPLIRKQHPQATLWVVGREPDRTVRAMAERDSSIKVTGRVDDIRPYIAKGAVYIVPLRVGSGTRLKIFEAMAMGKAVVSTTIGAEGLPVTNGVDVVLADEPDPFAKEVCRLLESASERKRIGKAARTLVEKNYSWEVVAKQVESVLRMQSLSQTSKSTY